MLKRESIVNSEMYKAYEMKSFKNTAKIKCFI